MQETVLLPCERRFFFHARDGSSSSERFRITRKSGRNVCCLTDGSYCSYWLVMVWTHPYSLSVTKMCDMQKWRKTGRSPSDEVICGTISIETLQNNFRFVLTYITIDPHTQKHIFVYVWIYVHRTHTHNYSSPIEWHRRGGSARHNYIIE